MMEDLSLCMLLCFVLLSIIKVVSGTDYATQVTTAVLTNYDKAVRPYCGGGATNVTLDIAVRQVIDLDEPNQVLKLSAWMRLIWSDCRLVWNATQYGNLGNIILPYNSLWIPDLALYDSVATEFVGLKDSRANIYSDGSVYYNFPSILESACPVNVQHFPFDTQNCELKLGSWAYHGGEINMFFKRASGGDLASAKENVEWDLLSFAVVRNVIYYACCADPYPDITFTLVMKRKPKFYVNNILVPSMLITALTLLGFFLPVDSGEKVSLQITVMLALAVFQLLVADKLPPDSELTPFISTFFNFGLFIVGLACVVAVLVDFIHFKGAQPLPRFLRVLFFKYLARITFVYLPERSKLSLKVSAVDTDTRAKGSKVVLVKEMNSEKPTQPEVKDKHPEEDLSDEDMDYLSEEWKLIAVVMDRMCFYMFTVLILLGSVIIILKMMQT